MRHNAIVSVFHDKGPNPWVVITIGHDVLAPRCCGFMASLPSSVAIRLPSTRWPARCRWRRDSRAVRLVEASVHGSRRSTAGLAVTAHRLRGGPQCRVGHGGVAPHVAFRTPPAEVHDN